MLNKILRFRNFGATVIIIGIAIMGFWHLIVAFLLQILALRWFVSRQVHKKMMSESRTQSGRNVPELETEEVSSTGPLKLIPTHALVTEPKYVAVREFMIKHIRSTFNRSLLIDIAAALGYVIPAFLLRSEAGVLIGIFIMFAVLLRFIFLRNQFRPIDNNFSSTKVDLGDGPLTLAWQGAMFFLREFSIALERGLLPGIVAWLLVLFLIESFQSGTTIQWQTVLSLLVAGGLHYYLFRLSRPKNGENIKLLILRTFGLNENSTFLFGRLTAFWSHVGNFFTIVDPSYLNHNYSIKSRRSLAVIILLIFLNFTLLPYFVDLNSSDLTFETGVGFIISFLIPLGALMIYEAYMINRNFVPSREAARQRFENIEQTPRQPFGLLYRGLPMMCYDNTWQATVAEMVNKADVVLMDLRGFSEKKKGCEYEIDYLMDNFPIERVVFMINPNDDHEFIVRTLAERWKYLRKHSPNLDSPGGERDHTVQIYISNAQDENDVQGIFDHLLGTAYQNNRIKGFPVSA